MLAKYTITVIGENEKEIENLEARPGWCAKSNCKNGKWFFAEEELEENAFIDWLINPARKNESAFTMLMQYERR